MAWQWMAGCWLATLERFQQKILHRRIQDLRTLARGKISVVVVSAAAAAEWIIDCPANKHPQQGLDWFVCWLQQYGTLLLLYDERYYSTFYRVIGGPSLWAGYQRHCLLLRAKPRLLEDDRVINILKDTATKVKSQKRHNGKWCPSL